MSSTDYAADLRRLRLLLRRRVLWLRTRWGRDDAEQYQGLAIGDAQADLLLAGESAAVEDAFYREDAEATRITRELAALTDPPPPRLARLVDAFGLTAFDRDVVLLCLAPDLDPDFEVLFAYVQDDAARRYPTGHLAVALFGDGRARFAATAPLRHSRLIAVEPGPLPAAPLGARPLRIEDRVADFLQGIDRLDERLTDLLRPVESAALPAGHRELVEKVSACLAEDAGRSVLLTGPPDAGKPAVAAALAAGRGRRLHRIDPRRLPAPGPDREDVLRLLDRDAALSGLAYYLEIPDFDPADRGVQTAVDDLADRLTAPLFLAGDRPREAAPALVVRVPPPDREARRGLWETALGPAAAGLNGQLDAVVEQFEFGPEGIARAGAAARLGADLWGVCREQAGERLGELAQRIEPCHGWEDLVLPDDGLRQLRETADQVAGRTRVYGRWGFGAKLNRGRGISVLFAGPSGTGKTLAAEVLAAHLRLDLFRIDLAGLVSKYIGETEKNLRRVFDAAEQSGAVLFFDEADALFGKRTEVKDSHDRYANIEVNYLLQRMEEYRGLAVLATNRRAALDRAFLRRLRFLIDFPAPDAGQRRAIWGRAFPVAAPLAGVDLDALARLDLTGGNIRTIALNAAFLAATDGGPITQAHVLRAARREFAKIEKRIPEAW